MATACSRLATFLPDRPLFRVPFFRSFIAFRTLSDAFLLYLAMFDSSFQTAHHAMAPSPDDMGVFSASLRGSQSLAGRMPTAAVFADVLTCG
jgi:hypothetical protein